MILLIIASAHAAHPHIVLILADDMGYGDPGCYNAESKIPTPNIDRLAAEGMRFTDAHAPGAVCVPSRYGLLTGRYPFRAKLDWRNGPVIDEGRTTIASLLRDRGYRTTMIGKWHQGFTGDHDQVEKRGGPVDRGFDEYFGIHASTDIPPYYYIHNDRAVALPTNQIPAGSSEGWSPIQGAFWREGGIQPGMRLVDVLPEFTRRAVETIEAHGKSGIKEKPLFLYLALAAPHTPWLPAEKWRGKSGAGLYGDFVMMVDDTVGQVMAALEKSGMADNTLVIFTSDNGPVWLPENVKQFGHSSTGNFRGMKGDAFEGGHRMPFIVRWPASGPGPGKVKPGSTSDQTICHTDLLATFADLTGAKLPPGAGEDSVSFLPALLGQDRGKALRDTLIVESSRGVLTIRQGPWKLIPALGSGGFTQPNRVKPGPKDPAGQLYNLANDPGETRNIYTEHPQVVERLTTLLNKTSMP